MRRALLLIGSVAYPVFWFAEGATGATHEPFWVRVLLDTPLLASLAGSYLWSSARARLQALVLACCYLITIHAFVTLFVNRMSAAQVLELFVTLAGFIAVSTAVLASTRQLAGYFAGVVVATLLTIALVGSPKTDPLFLLVSVSTIAALGFVTVRGHLLTVAELAKSELELSRDIARREEAERALRTSESRSRALVQALPDVMVVVDAAGTVLEVQSETNDDLGRRVTDLVRLRDPLWRLFSNLDGGATQRAIAAAIETRSTQTFEQELRDSEPARQIELRIAAVSSEAALALLRDVTERRVMEANLRLNERLLALGTLASGVAHEINNPLSYVLGNVEYALSKLDQPGSAALAPDLREVLAEAKEGAERIRTIVHDLKEQSRPDEASRGATDVNQAVASALRVLDHQLKHRVVVVRELEEGKLLASAGTGRLVQVLLNLLANAADAMPPRPMTENRIVVRTRRVGGAAVIEVEDNGSGIPDNILSRIFDPFFTTKPQGKGTGLGLYVCHKLVTGFGGNLTAQSRVGEGTIFRITLQPSEEAVSEVQPTAQSQDVGGVLVLDDDLLVARSVARMIKGRDVQIANDVDTALALCAERDFDVVLCDLMLPGKNGADFYEALKSIKPALLPRIVFLTGGVFSEALERFVASVDSPCLLKPVERRDLSRVLEALARDRDASALAS